jgi:hypothetical protein
MPSTSLATFCVLALLSACARASPLPRVKPAVSASTGCDTSPGSLIPCILTCFLLFRMGGNASGGSVYSPAGSDTLVSAFSGMSFSSHTSSCLTHTPFSGNGGNGGDASSIGDPFASDSSRTNSAGSSDVLEGSPFGGSLVNIVTGRISLYPCIPDSSIEPGLGGEQGAGVNNIL